MLSKKLLVPSKKNVIYLALTFIALLCGCQEREKTIYRVPLSEHAMELERQEKAYNDSLEKYSALLDTAQVRYYFDLHKAVLDTLGVVMQQEAEAFMAAKDREAANEENSSMTTELILLGIAIVLLIAMIIYVSITTLFWDPHRLVLRGRMALAETSPHHPQTDRPSLLLAHQRSIH